MCKDSTCLASFATHQEAAAFAQLLARAEAALPEEAFATFEREAILDNAIRAGKIPAESRDQYREQYDRDRSGTLDLLAALAPGFAHSTFARAATAEQAAAELLAGARAAFPELERHGRKSSRGSSAPPSRAHLPTTGVGSKDSQAVSPPALRAGWYRRENGQPVRKGIQRSRSPLWPTILADPTVPAPFPAGLEVT